MDSSLQTTIGALLLGSWCSIALWGAMTYQSYSFALRVGDNVGHLKIMVTTLWVLDTLHIIFAVHAVFWYLITNDASPQAVGEIIWSLPVTIAITAAITFIVQLFFARRIYILSGNNKIIAFLILSSATARVTFATITTTRAILCGTFLAFERFVRFLVTTGLALSVFTDFLITITLCIFLSRYRTGFSTDTIVGTIMRWTIQTGALTSVFGLLSMICAVTMPHNLVWLGVHMVISKLYTTTTISHLNSRELARDERLKHAEDRHGLNLRQISKRSRAYRKKESFIQAAPQVSIHVERGVYVEPDEEVGHTPTMEKDASCSSSRHLI